MNYLAEIEEEHAPDFALDGRSFADPVGVYNAYTDLGVGTSASAALSIVRSSDVHTEPGTAMSATDLRPLERELAPEADFARNVFSANFFGSKSTCTLTSVFSSDIEVLRRLAVLHSIDLEHDITIPNARMALVKHIINSDCFVQSRKNRKGKMQAHSPPTDTSLCVNMALQFTSQAEMTDYFVDIVLSHANDSKLLPTDKLFVIAEALHTNQSGILTGELSHLQKRRTSLRILHKFRKAKTLTDEQCETLTGPGSGFETLHKPELVSIALSHGISVDSRKVAKEELKQLIVDHLVRGRCLKDLRVHSHAGTVETSGSSCSQLLSEYLASQSTSSFDPVVFRLHSIMKATVHCSKKTLSRFLDQLGLVYSPQDSIRQMRYTLKCFVVKAQAGKDRVGPHTYLDNVEADMEDRRTTREQWPQLVSDQLKRKIVSLFRTMTSKHALESFTCASCGASASINQRQLTDVNDIEPELLKRPDLFEDDMQECDRWLDSSVLPPPMPYSAGVLADMLLNTDGVRIVEGVVTLELCKECSTHLKRKDVPPLALSNRMYLGPVPSELSGLTVVEEAMIARCRAQAWVIQLKEDCNGPVAQRAMKGHVIVYPQQPSALAEVLPPSIDDIISPLCVVFVGPKKPSDQWIQEHAKPLTMRGDKVRQALLWLKQHNRHYKDIKINEAVLEQLETNPVLPFHVEHVLNSDHMEERTSRYDESPLTPHPAAPGEYPFPSVVVTDIKGEATTRQQRAAALKHLKTKGKSYIAVGRGSEPVNEINNPDLLPMIYPCLFPYGIGGLNDPNRSNTRLSLERHVRHLFSLSDRRFQEHYSFLFTVFNMIQRKKMLTRTKLRVNRDRFDIAAKQFASVSASAIHTVSERMARGDNTTACNEEERRVLQLMREVNGVTSHVPGTPSGRAVMRQEIRALMVDQGLPNFYLTINPADVYNPLVRFLAGDEIDPDNILPEDHDYLSQARCVASNPAAAAKFFNIYMNAFIYALLGYDSKHRNAEGGILGKVKAYYGCVEAQGRGSLHCHMLVWVEGGLNADEIKKKSG